MPILLVEDREDDVLLIKRAFEKAGIPQPVNVVRDGEEAKEYLAGQGRFSNRAEHPLPWLVLLDLKMPKVDGFQVLTWLRGVPELRAMIVVVLTSSEAVRDVNEAYRLGANSFLVKPLEFTNTVSLARLIRHYWLMHNKFPQPTAAAGVRGTAG